MKKLIIASLLMGSSLMAMSTKVEKPVSLLEGTTLGSYQKPGAPVDLTYKSSKVGADEIAMVDITLTTRAKEGSMRVAMRLDEGLRQTGGDALSNRFTLGSAKEFPLHLQLLSTQEGRYYVKLLVEIEGRGVRAFSVPVQVGEGSAKLKLAPTTTTPSGERIEVMSAVEVIEK